MTYEELVTFTPTPSYRVHSDWRFLEHTLEDWCDPVRNKGFAVLDLNPDFQRGHVWTPEQQSAYVEYILRGGMSGRELYFNCVGWQGSYKGPFVIVDGKQRLEAVRRFMRSEIPICGGYYHKDMEGRLPTTAQFIMCVNNLPTRAKVLKWYLEMNSGGTPHTQEELGRVRELLREAQGKKL